MKLDDEMRNSQDSDEKAATVGPNNHIRVGVAVVVTLAAIGLTAQIAQFKATMVNDMSWMKTSLATLVTRFDSLETVKQQVDRLERYGSSAAQDMSKKTGELEARMKLVEEFGSPWCRKENDKLKGDVETLRKLFETHELKGSGK